MIKRILIFLLVALVVMQFIRPVKNISTTVSAQDINQVYPMPDSVHQILARACLDCHSDNTRYPWYYNIQPVAWWMNDHITEAKHELNFSHFGAFSQKRQIKKMTKVAKSVKEGWMPLDNYLWIHKDAILTDQEKKTIIDWATALAAQIKSKPASQFTTK